MANGLGIHGYRGVSGGLEGGVVCGKIRQQARSEHPSQLPTMQGFKGLGKVAGNNSAALHRQKSLRTPLGVPTAGF